MGIELGETIDCLQSMSDDCFVADTSTIEPEDRCIWMVDEIIGEIRLCHDMMRIVVRVLVPHPVAV